MNNENELNSDVLVASNSYNDISKPNRLNCEKCKNNF